MIETCTQGCSVQEGVGSWLLCLAAFAAALPHDTPARRSPPSWLGQRSRSGCARRLRRLTGEGGEWEGHLSGGGRGCSGGDALGSPAETAAAVCGSLQ